jgi:glutamyl-tRNA reductase
MGFGNPYGDPYSDSQVTQFVEILQTLGVSIVSLAYHRLKEASLPLDSRILIVGAGTTNVTFSKLLYKYGFRNFSFFNRTLGNAEKLAKDNGGAAYDLGHLEKYQSGFDVLITCTGADEPLITPKIYNNLLNSETDKKTIVDLAIPCDTHPEIIETQNTLFISVADLKEISEINMQRRIQEVYHVQVILDEALSAFHRMYRERQVELAMRAVPERVREIKNITKAMFAKELETLDPKSQELMERMMAVMEKKYLSVPMKMAKEIIIQQQ